MEKIEILKQLSVIADNSNSNGIKTSALAIERGKIVAIGHNLILRPDNLYRPTKCHNMSAMHAEEMLVKGMRLSKIAPRMAEVHLSHYPCILCINYMRGYGIERVVVHGSMAYPSAQEYASHLTDFEIIAEITHAWYST